MFAFFDLDKKPITPAFHEGIEAALAHVRENKLSLANADLSGLTLTDLNFSGLTLNGANLSGAFCMGANFSDAEMMGILANGTQFSASKFDDANLTGSDLHGSNLRFADFVGTNLQSTTLTGCEWGQNNVFGANFANANVSECFSFVQQVQVLDFNIIAVDRRITINTDADWYDAWLPRLRRWVKDGNYSAGTYERLMGTLRYLWTQYDLHLTKRDPLKILGSLEPTEPLVQVAPQAN